jgi:hypothetical protein
MRERAVIRRGVAVRRGAVARRGVVVRRGAATIAAVAAALLVPAPARADGIRSAQWHLDVLDIATAHRHSLGTGALVAIVDSGVDAGHPDLTGSVLPPIPVPGVTPTGPDESDVDGRGTGLAGLIAGHGHGTAGAAGTPSAPGGDGVLGIAPGARIVPVAITNRPGQFGDPDLLAEGIDLAVARGVRVICVGRGLPASPRLERAVAAAVRAGALIVAPLANRRNETFLPWPASYPGVLAVAPVDRAGNTSAAALAGRPDNAGAAAPGPETPLRVPGVDLLSTEAGGGYRIEAGAGAAAVAAGAVALVWARYPELPAAEVRARLADGRGRLDLVGALTKGVPATVASRPPGVSPPGVSPPAAAPTSGPSAAPAATAAAPPAAFDSGDWRRWLVALPLVAFLAALLGFAFGGRRHGRG